MASVLSTLHSRVACPSPPCNGGESPELPDSLRLVPHRLHVLRRSVPTSLCILTDLKNLRELVQVCSNPGRKSTQTAARCPPSRRLRCGPSAGGPTALPGCTVNCVACSLLSTKTAFLGPTGTCVFHQRHDLCAHSNVLQMFHCRLPSACDTRHEHLLLRFAIVRAVVSS